MDTALLQTLGQELVNSPFLSIMILNERYEIVWHNHRFAEEMSEGKDVTGRHCFEVAGSEGIHDNCPLMLALKDKKRVNGFLDFGDVNFYYLTVPVGDNLAAKIHVFLPKEPDNQRVIKSPN